MDGLQQAFEAYLWKRAQDKYDGKDVGLRSLEEFRKCVDYLAGIAGNAEFGNEDIEDMLRMAVSRSRSLSGSAEETVART